VSKCEHNDHGHMTLWFVIVLTMIGSCKVSERMRRENDRLRDRVDKRERECVPQVGHPKSMRSMTKFRARPVIVNATQYDGTRGVVTNIPGLCYCPNPAVGNPHVHTRGGGGAVQVHHGDWIVTGVNGDHHACNPAVFEMTYERVMRPGEIGDEDG